MPISHSPPRWPASAVSVGDSGKTRVKSGLRFGRTWNESYAPLDLHDQFIRAWLAKLNRLYNQGILFTLQHPSLQVNAGAYGGVPQIDGANQIGESINIKGATPGVAGWAKAGDILRWPGPLANLVIDVIADADTDGAGKATLVTAPPIYTTANSPPDSNNVTVATVKFRAMIVALNLPETEQSKMVDVIVGLSLSFREVW
jgi:hypothetical protein